jgi:hypothetical protein
MPVKTILNFSAVSFLALALPSFCCALEDIDVLTKERAKELGLVIQSNPAGPDAVRVVLEFGPKGELKNYKRVELAMYEGGRLLMSSTLREEEAKPGHVVVSFAADRKKLDQIELKIVVQYGPRSRTGYVLKLTEFVNLEKAR